MFDTFCNLSITYREDGFVTMLAPFRDYLRPKDPMASSLLRMAKEHYFKWLSVDLNPSEPDFHKSRWIASEDVNVEHLLDVFTSIDADSEDVWVACNYFMNHLRWHKPRLVILGPKFEALPDSHPEKPYCLVFLSQLFAAVGNWVEQRRMLINSLGLWREGGNDYRVAETLVDLSDVNRTLGFREEGIQQAREASSIFGRLGETEKQAYCLLALASLLQKDEQLDAAEEAASRALDLSENRNQHHLCQCHRVLGEIHQYKGNTEKAIHYFEASLQTASVLGLGILLSQGHFALAFLYFREGKHNDAHAHIKHTKSHAGSNTLLLGHAVLLSAHILYQQDRSEEGKLEALRGLAIFEKLGATGPAESARQLLEIIERELDDDGKPLKWCSLWRLFTSLIRTQTPNPYDGGESCPAYTIWETSFPSPFRVC